MRIAFQAQIGRHQRRLPVVGVDQVRCPILVQCACGELGRGGSKPAEAHVVVRPVPAGAVAVGIARAVIELWTQQDVDGQAVPGGSPPQRAGRHFRERIAMADDFKMGKLLDDVPVSRQHHPDVAPKPQCPGQRRRDGGKSADPDEVIHFRGDEQDPQESSPISPGHIYARICKNGSSFVFRYAGETRRLSKLACAARNAFLSEPRPLGSRHARVGGAGE